MIFFARVPKAPIKSNLIRVCSRVQSCKKSYIHSFISKKNLWTASKWKNDLKCRLNTIHPPKIEFPIHGKRVFGSAPIKKWDEKDEELTNLVEDMLKYLPRSYYMDADLTKWDSGTHQRKQFDCDFDANNGKPILSSKNESQGESLELDAYWIETSEKVDDDRDFLFFQWSDGSISKFSVCWVKKQIEVVREALEEKDTSTTTFSNVRNPDKILWSHLTAEDLRKPGMLSLPFNSIIENDDAIEKAIRILYQYGILLVTDTPFDDGGAAVAAFSAAVSGGDMKESSSVSLLKYYRDKIHSTKYNNSDTLSSTQTIMLPDGTDGPLRTLYGSIWSTSSECMPAGGSVSDSAYGQGSLPLHNDMAYMKDPPGLQIFQMIQPAINGGESTYGDGLAVAERLRETCPKSFHTLCSVDRTYRSIDEATGWHLEARGPIIQAHKNGDGTYGRVQMIRHNDLDRLPDLPSKACLRQGRIAVQAFYDDLREAHLKWDELIANEEFRIEINLNAGDLVAVANQRCLHGRKSFSTTSSAPRAIGGSYTSQDELDSRYRRAGFVVD